MFLTLFHEQVTDLDTRTSSLSAQFLSFSYSFRQKSYQIKGFRLKIRDWISYYRPQRSWGKVMFLQAGVILFTAGKYLTRYTPRDQVPGTPPGTRYTLRDQVHPQDQVHPPRPGTPPGNRCPPDQVHPLDKVPPRPGTPPPGTPPRTRYTPRPGTPPRNRCPLDQVHPRDQVHPPGPGTPPRTREIRSTHGRYTSYWNAFLLTKSVADPGFPQGGGANSPGGVPTYDFAKFFQKLHEIERIWAPRGGARPLCPP